LSQHRSIDTDIGTKNNGPGEVCAGNRNRGGTPQPDSLGSPPAEPGEVASNNPI
jgi:hypothetical protein